MNISEVRRFVARFLAKPAQSSRPLAPAPRRFSITYKTAIAVMRGETVHVTDTRTGKTYCIQHAELPQEDPHEFFVITEERPKAASALHTAANTSIKFGTLKFSWLEDTGQLEISPLNLDPLPQPLFAAPQAFPDSEDMPNLMGRNVELLIEFLILNSGNFVNFHNIADGIYLDIDYSSGSITSVTKDSNDHDVKLVLTEIDKPCLAIFIKSAYVKREILENVELLETVRETIVNVNAAIALAGVQTLRNIQQEAGLSEGAMGFFVPIKAFTNKYEAIRKALSIEDIPSA